MDLSPLEELEARIRRFERLGGVNLSHLEQEERDSVLGAVRVGIAHYKKAIFHYRCPLCSKIELSDMEMEPACTGPNWTDEHPMEIMELIQ